MPTTSPISPVLVTGATGKTGRRVTRSLEAMGVTVRAASRAGATRFDWDDRSSWGPALEGAAGLSIAYAPDLTVPGAAETIAALAGAAREAGVRRIVLLSGRGEEEAQRAERLLQAAAPAATIVRSAFFMQNFSEGIFLEPVLAGELALPVGDAAEPFVDAGDVAGVMVAALTEDGHAGRVHEVTGPRLLTFAQAVAEIARAAGREVGFVTVPAVAYAHQLAAAGVPDDVVQLLLSLFAEVLDGRNASVTDGVQQALGRPPRDFAEYAAGVARTGAWDPVAV